ncbi:hypothetical protein AAMO2058_000920500 [Amorphochlora amoebiformis]
MCLPSYTGGRSKKNSIMIKNDRKVSGLHFKIHKGAVLEALKPMDYNGSPIDRRIPLKDDGLVCLGERTRLLIKIRRALEVVAEENIQEEYLQGDNVQKEYLQGDNAYLQVTVNDVVDNAVAKVLQEGLASPREGLTSPREDLNSPRAEEVLEDEAEFLGEDFIDSLGDITKAVALDGVLLEVDPKSRDKLSVGRSRKCSLTIRDDAKISGSHFYVQKGILKDTSKLGIIINGEKMKSDTWRLTDGDVLKFGNSTKLTIRFVERTTNGSSAAPLRSRVFTTHLKSALSQPVAAKPAATEAKIKNKKNPKSPTLEKKDRNNSKKRNCKNSEKENSKNWEGKSGDNDSASGKSRDNTSNRLEPVTRGNSRVELAQAILEKGRGIKEKLIETRETFDGSEKLQGLGAGDSFLIPGFLDKKFADQALGELSNEKMVYVQMYAKAGKSRAVPLARLKRTEADIENKKMGVPIYRYPVVNQAACPTVGWTKCVRSIRNKCEKLIKHKLNHCVLNLYRNKDDYIGPHSDKMLDIQQGSQIISISLGEMRPMILISNDCKHMQTIHLPHGSIFVIGPKTNKLWKHSIPKVKKEVGVRVSLTIRNIATHVTFDESDKTKTPTLVISGQGKQYQTPNWPYWEHKGVQEPTYTTPKGKPRTKTELLEPQSPSHLHSQFKLRSQTQTKIQTQTQTQTQIQTETQIQTQPQLKQLPGRAMVLNNEVIYNGLLNGPKKDANAIDQMSTQVRIAEVAAKLEVKDSIFYAFLLPCRSTRDAAGAMEGLKERFPKAIHIPFSANFSDGRQAHGDDGEPKRAEVGRVLGRALLSKQVLDIGLFVVREWQGTKLGIRGLKHAYLTVAEAAVEALKLGIHSQPQGESIKSNPGEANTEAKERRLL